MRYEETIAQVATHEIHYTLHFLCPLQESKYFLETIEQHTIKTKASPNGFN